MRYNFVYKLLTCLLFFISLVTHSAVSTEKFISERSEVSLISTIDTVGYNTESFYLGLSFNLKPEWHIYWINSGDSGTPPTFNWENSSPALEFNDPNWPSPRRLPLPPLMSYGYEGKVIIPTQVKVINKSEKSFNVKLKANWLICKVECIPESHTFTLSLPLNENEKQSSELASIQEALSKQPEKSLPLKSSQTSNTTHYMLSIAAPTDELFNNLQEAYFFPEKALKIKHASAQSFTHASSNVIQLEIERDENDSNSAEPLNGILELKFQDTTQYAWISAEAGSAPTEAFKFSALLMSSLFAFLGGLLLNLMPCVFPVLFLKLFALAKNTLLTPQQKKLEAWSYTAGVISSFLLLAVVLFALKQFGFAVGWGFQLQNPIFVSLSVLLFIAMGLSMLGVFEISGSFVGAGQSLTQKSGNKGSFFTGVLATLVATPCSAPFMGSAVGYALSRQSWESFPIFLLLGFGLACPYLLLAYYPSLLKWIPKPGPWMERLKEFFGFALLGTALWLLWIFGTQRGSDAMTWLLCSGLFLAMGLWALRLGNKKIKLLIIIFSLLGTFSFLNKTINTEAINSNSEKNTNGNWQPFSPDKLNTLLEQNQSVFIDYTASWCLTCQVNKKLVLSTSEAEKLFEDNKIITLRADWTLYDPIITQSLSKLGRQSVPVYAYYSKGKKEPVLLPELLNLSLLKKAIEEN